LKQDSLISSLYIHFPFCESRCHYCDFYALGKEKMKSEDPLQFEEALRTEIHQWSPWIAPRLDTLFFGGGTPSMTAYDSIARAMEPLWKRSSLHAKTEWTMEANPSSVELQAFRSFRSYGVNRISLGVQAMQKNLLHSLGRVHSPEKVHEALSLIFQAGFENVSSIYSVEFPRSPNQT
jgi:oxygen-independent coproporphyrinogen-3 oxidase